jgi:hypothetical protein
MKGCAKPILVSAAKTAAAALLMGGAAYFLFMPLERWLGVKVGGAAAILAAGVLYAFLIFLFRVVTVNELKNIRKRG